jgi:tRNA1Val (adenine37-N6)-methyltransferase
MNEETLDTIFDGKVKLYQSRGGYRFSLDALLLGHFVKLKKGDRVVDIGTGNGIIPLVLARLHPEISVTGVEVQPAMAERAKKNVELNGLEKRIRICQGDVRRIDSVAPPASFDVVVSNPPYRQPGSGRISANDEKQIARHEICGDLDAFLGAAEFLLRARGRIALIHLAERAVDLLTSMRRLRLEPKRLRMVHSRLTVAASLLLIEGVKNGRGGMEILPPLMVYRQGKEYSDEVAALIAGRHNRNSEYLSQRR